LVDDRVNRLAEKIAQPDQTWDRGPAWIAGNLASPESKAPLATFAHRAGLKTV